MINFSSIKKTLMAASAIGVVLCSGGMSVNAQPMDATAAAASEIRFQQLEREIRRLTGQIEEQNFEIRRLRDELAKATGDLSVRVDDLEKGGNGAPSNPAQIYEPDDAPDATPPVQNSGSFQYQPPPAAPVEPQQLGTLNVKPDSGSVSSADSVSGAYDFAYSFIKARDFDRAEKEFGKFIEMYPDVPLVSNAKYWYGETFYVRGNYDRAARIFAEGYQKFPKGPKAASNLLKLGMSLSGMGKKEDACIAYKQLKKEYSNSTVSVLKRAETEMKKINCQ